MNPGIVIPDIGHFKQIFVQTGVDQGFLEQGFMGFGGTGRHHDPVQIFLFDDADQIVLCVLGTGIEVVGCKLHIGKGRRILRNRWNIDDAGNVDAASADKYADTGPLAGNIDFRNNFLCLGKGISCQAQNFSRHCRSSAGIDNRLRNVFGPLEGAAHNRCLLLKCSPAQMKWSDRNCPRSDQCPVVWPD